MARERTPQKRNARERAEVILESADFGIPDEMREASVGMGRGESMGIPDYMRDNMVFKDGGGSDMAKKLVGVGAILVGGILLGTMKLTGKLLEKSLLLSGGDAKSWKTGYQMGRKMFGQKKYDH